MLANLEKWWVIITMIIITWLLGYVAKNIYDTSLTQSLNTQFNTELQKQIPTLCKQYEEQSKKSLPINQ